MSHKRFAVLAGAALMAIQGLVPSHALEGTQVDGLMAKDDAAFDRPRDLDKPVPDIGTRENDRRRMLRCSSGRLLQAVLTDDGRQLVNQ